MPKTFIIQKKISPKIHMKSKKKKKNTQSNPEQCWKYHEIILLGHNNKNKKISVSGIEDSQTHIATAV